MSTSIDKNADMPSKIIDWTNGEKPGKGYHEAILIISGSDVGYRVIGKDPPLPPTPAQIRAERKAQAEHDKYYYE